MRTSTIANAATATRSSATATRSSATATRSSATATRSSIKAALAQAKVAEPKTTEPNAVFSNEELTKLVSAVYEANKLKNEADRKYNALRATLFQTMVAADIKSFTTDTHSAVIACRESEKIDVHALRKLVDDETFMKIVSASKEATETHAGRAIVSLSAKLVKGDENVTVKPL